MGGHPPKRARLFVRLPGELIVGDALQRAARAVHFHVELGEDRVFVGHRLLFSGKLKEFVIWQFVIASQQPGIGKANYEQIANNISRLRAILSATRGVDGPAGGLSAGSIVFRPL